MYIIELEHASDDQRFSVRNFTLEEGLSTSFQITVEVMSHDDSVDLEALIGETMTLRFARSPGDAEGQFRTGLCCHAEQTSAEPSGLSGYALTLVPSLWLLNQRSTCRIFQRKTSIQICETLLTEWKIEYDLRLVDEYPVHEYRTQYNESDYSLFSRLLGEAGVTFSFEHYNHESRLILSDSPQSAEALSPAMPFWENATTSNDQVLVTNVHISSRMAQGRKTIRGFDFRRRMDFVLMTSAVARDAREHSLESYEFIHNAFNDECGNRDTTPSADDRGAFRSVEKVGARLASRMLESQQASRSLLTMQTNALYLSPGVVFGISQHPNEKINEHNPLLVTGYRLHANMSGPWLVSLEAAFAAQPFRPKPAEHRTTIAGVQSAVVVGPSGSEIHTDEFGRVRVHFHWDRTADYNDENSCWLRVSQGWAGAGFGMYMTPRVGQEVLIGFFDGDPDLPIVVGRVFNYVSRPSVGLPGSATQSAWRSQSTPGGDGFNEVAFEDSKGNENFNIQAERNLTKLVKLDETEVTGRDRNIVVVSNRSSTVGKVDSVVVGEKQIVTVDGTETGMQMTNQNIRQSTGGASSSMTADSYSVNTSGPIGLVAGGKLDLTSTGAMTLKSGGKMTLEAGGDMDISASGSITISTSGTITVNGGDVVVQGGTVKIN